VAQVPVARSTTPYSASGDLVAALGGLLLALQGIALWHRALGEHRRQTFRDSRQAGVS
jgi:hypothetical protein